MYFSSTPNIPLFKEKNDGYFQGGVRLTGLDFQTGVSPGDNWGICGSGGYTLNSISYPSEEPIDTFYVDPLWMILNVINFANAVETGGSLQIFGDLAFCIFSRFGVNNEYILEGQLGYGYGRQAQNTDHEKFIDFHKTFVQLDCGKREKNTSIAWGAKLSWLHFGNYSIDDVPQEFYPNYYTLEPFVYAGIGNEKYIKLYIKVAYPLLISERDENLLIESYHRVDLGIERYFTLKHDK